MVESNNQEPKKKAMSYMDILTMDYGAFLKQLFAWIPPIEINMDDENAMRYAGARMAQMANVMSALEQMSAIADGLKRQKKAEMSSKAGEEKAAARQAYEDLIDKGKAIDGAIKALDMQHRSINKSLNVWLELRRDQYMTDSVGFRK